jgi:hypothetical protein
MKANKWLLNTSSVLVYRLLMLLVARGINRYAMASEQLIHFEYGRMEEVNEGGWRMEKVDF